MARLQSQLTPHKSRKSGGSSNSSSTRLMQLNDDAAEKENRINSNDNRRRHSLMTVARETVRNNQTGASTGEGAPILANFEQWMKLVKDNVSNKPLFSMRIHLSS